MKIARYIILTALIVAFFSCKKEYNDASLLSSPAAFDNTLSPSAGDRSYDKRYSFPEIDWKMFETHEEKVQALQIPDSDLKIMDTYTLIWVLFDYPLLFDAFAYDDIQYGLEHTLSQFNAFREWYHREDKIESFDYFRERWESERVPTGVLSPIEEGRHSLTNQLIACFSRLPVLAEEYDKAGITIEQNHLKSHKVLKTTSSNYANYYATTPLGSIVDVYPSSGYYSSSEIQSIRAYFQHYYPNAIILSDPTYSYNCHAYAWWMSEGGNERWMDNPSTYIVDGSYIQVDCPLDIPHKVAYYNGSIIEHSAVYTAEADTRLVSKWGPSCLMKHSVLDCPYSTSDIRDYRLKWEISGDSLVDLQLTPNGQASPATAIYSVSDFPSTCSIEWSVSGLASIVNGQYSPTVSLSILGNFSIGATMTNTSGHSTTIFGKKVKASHAPIVTDIDFFQYWPTSPGHYVMKVIANKSNGDFSWETTGGVLQDLTYPYDATFMMEPTLFKEILFSQPGIYTITVESMLDNHYYLFEKNVYVDASLAVSNY